MHLPQLETTNRAADFQEIMSDFIMTSIARVVPHQQSVFGHRFGGPSGYQGTIPQGCSQPLHLLYVLDTTDPLVPVRVPNVRYLPLFYCFPYNAGDVSYRVISDAAIEIVYMQETHVEPDFPYPHYPNEFPQIPVLLVAIVEEEHEILANYVTSPASVTIVGLPEENRRCLERLNYPFTQLGGVQRVWQGIPDAECPNKDCDSSTLGDVFAVVWNQPVPDVFLWDNDPNPDIRDDEGIEIIFQICPKCHVVNVCNSCT